MAVSTQNSAASSFANRPGLRGLLSVLLALHVLAVFVGPWAMGGASLPRGLMMLMRPYIEPAVLDNGYRFFAPDPGPSHLVRYELELPDGRQKEGRFPDHDEQWPRLLYHRYFMLSEFLNTALYNDPDRKPDARAEAYIRSYARHLALHYGARRVTLYLIHHDIPSPEQVQGGMKLTDPSLYQERKLGTFDSEGKRV